MMVDTTGAGKSALILNIVNGKGVTVLDQMERKTSVVEKVDLTGSWLA